MIKAIIFDFDGVIHDTLDLTYNIFNQIYPELTMDDYKDFFNGNFHKHKKITKEVVEVLFKHQNREFKKLKIEREIRNELLKLKDKYELFIVSSNMEIALNDYFENNNIMYIFKEVLGLESHKLKIEKFRFLLDKHELDKNNCIFVTDTLGDILEANKLGLNTIAVDCGFHERKRLEQGKPMKIISDFSDLYPLINNL